MSAELPHSDPDLEKLEAQEKSTENNVALSSESSGVIAAEN